MYKIEEVIGESLYSEIKSKEGIGADHYHSLYIHVIPKELTGLPNDKYYVGVTRQKQVEDRWRNGRNYKTSKLNIPIIQFGWDNFEHLVVSRRLSRHDVQKYEALLINLLHTKDDAYGYNIVDGGFGKPKIFQPHFGVNQYDYNGNLIKHWNDVYDAVDYLMNTGKCKSAKSGIQTIELVCNGIYSKAYKYRWTYEDQPLDNSVGFKEYCYQKDVYCFSLDGELLAVYNSMAEASVQTGIKQSAISACVTGRNKSACGYYFSYENCFVEHIRQNKISRGILQLNENLVPVGRYFSISFAHKMTGFTDDLIRYLAEYNEKINNTDEYKSSKGYIWLFDPSISNNDYHYTVAQYNILDGTLIGRYHNCVEAADSIGMTRQRIAQTCRSNANTDNNNHSFCGFIWRYEDYDKPISECNIFLTDDLPIKEGHILPIGVTL